MTIYLQIPEQKGAVTEQGYRNWINVLGLSFSTDKASKSLLQGHEIFIYKQLDHSSPFFFTQACGGQVIPHIKIDITETAHTPYIQYELENVLISEYDSFSISDDTPIESIGFNYTHLTMRSTSYENGIAKSYSFRMDIGSKPSPQVQLKRHITTRSDEGFKLFVATVYGEAANQSEVAWQAIASVIINRVDNKRFKYDKEGQGTRFYSPSEVIMLSGFDACKEQTPLFKFAFSFMNNEKKPENVKIMHLINTLKPIYYQNKVTTNATMYYSPTAQHWLHEHNPKKYPVKPKWNYPELEEVQVTGLLNTDDFKFFKYK